MAYFYNTETNYYAEDNGTTGSAAYIQGGALSKIEYGLRAGEVYGRTHPGRRGDLHHRRRPHRHPHRTWPARRARRAT